MVYFFSENYYKYHYSNYCSNAFIFMVVLILFSILLPFFTNLGSLDQFWKPRTVYTDHPIVQFNDEFLIQLSNSNGDTLTLNTYQLSDEKGILSTCTIETQDYSNKDIINVIKFKGHIDYFENNANFNDIKFFIFFDYYMTEDVNIHIRSKAHIFYSNFEDISKFGANGDLILKQNKGLVETYFMEKDGTSTFEDEVNEVLNDPFNRDANYYFEFKKNNIIVNKANEEENLGLDIDITINIPYYQDIIVELPNYTNLKNKWVLYSILFFPTLFVCYWLMELVINNQIFKTRIRSDIPIKL